MKRWFLRSLNHKLSLLILLAVMVPLLVLGTFTYLIASDVTQAKTKQSGLNMLQQLQTNLTFIAEDVDNISVFLIGQRTVQDYLRGRDADVTLLTDATVFVSALAASKPYIADITIYPANPALSYISSTAILESALPDIEETEPDYFARHTKWWSPVYDVRTTSGTSPVMTLVRPIRTIGTYKRLGLLTISIRQDYVQAMLEKPDLAEGGSILLLNAADRVLAGGSAVSRMKPASELYPGLPAFPAASGSLEYGTGEAKKSVLFESVPQAGWRLAGFIPYRFYNQQNRYVLQLTAIAVGIAFLLVAALVLTLVQWVVRPLKTIARFLKDADPEQPIPQYKSASIDEVGQLVHSYNKLTMRIESLTEQVKKKETRKKETDMLALQAQIHPHFLYNTLSSIHWMALMNKDGKIAEMVGSLSDFLRFSLNKGVEFCTVEQEIAHATHYGTIQSMRYPDKFKLRFFIEPGMLHRSMLKLLLQPLIENALMHGIRRKQGEGVISVHGNESAGLMVFVVEDDGAGMAPGRLAELRASLDVPTDQDAADPDGEPPSGYGLRNVHQRLRLHYGPRAGLAAESAEGRGTRITFAIPVLEGGTSGEGDDR